jgi:D-sedoheptulose 7-phosphate isomerase
VIHHDLVQLHKHRTQPFLHDRALTTLLARRNAFGAALDRLCADATCLDAAAGAMIACLRAGGRILVAGNGGSAAEAQHFATELVGRFLRERDPYAVLSLTADTAVLTAIANDYGYEHVFARQVDAYAHPGDVFVGFSTSGASPNLVKAAGSARERGVTSIAVTGARVSPLADLADIAIRAPADETPLIQELHTIILHVLCDLVETALAAVEPDRVVAVQ